MGNGTIDQNIDPSTWPELVYRFVEHYKWEPQHLNGSVNAFYQRIRSHEVPLNFLLNLLLRWSPSETIALFLDQFGVDLTGLDRTRLHLKHPWSTKYTQPDVRIESDAARIFIEVKVGASIKIEQVHRYLLLHAEMNSRFGKKQPYLFFLTETNFQNCWRPLRETLSFENLDDFLKLRIDQTRNLETVTKLRRLNDASTQYESVVRDVKYGSATWASIGECLALRRSQCLNDSAREVEARALNDFLMDLTRRGFLMQQA